MGSPSWQDVKPEVLGILELLPGVQNRGSFRKCGQRGGSTTNEGDGGTLRTPGFSSWRTPGGPQYCRAILPRSFPWCWIVPGIRCTWNDAWSSLPRGRKSFVTASLFRVKCGPAGSQTLQNKPVQCCRAPSTPICFKKPSRLLWSNTVATNLVGLWSS